MGSEFSTHEGRMNTTYWWESLKQRHHYADLNEDGNIILK
jgi:hypothetical protein